MRATQGRVRARAKKLAENRKYHHGDLHEALIKAGDEILREYGADGFSLREAARRAGVSPAAPAYHFGNSRGLLTEIAALGFLELTRFMNEELAKAGDNPAERLAATGRGYTRFSFQFPGRFRLMFSRERLNFHAPSLQQNSDQAFSIFKKTIEDLRDWSAESGQFATMQEALMMAWCVAHGFASLAFHRQFDRFIGQAAMPEFLTEASGNILSAFAQMLANHEPPDRASPSARAHLTDQRRP